jgi:hypothetical protein
MDDIKRQHNADDSRSISKRHRVPIKTKPHLYTDTSYMITSPVAIILQHVGELDYTMPMTSFTMQMTGNLPHACKQRTG